ncbi:Putative acetyltransferase EpsM [Bdellovibrio bacteriovorus]|uniref:acetyltransferase n=1 Tax=Bdellovibrio bacteriovorus TaxID=959 RepID=UPI00045C0088|nr:acetyltransferase [Bdellovibrio bacteriovorus]AHZ84223.1 hypothetical protein EP01_04605 [Bdellovibrio bacteriovorus]BEV68108.1 Putative acetyltransferase EpsM [Bdellovibrio bacteriovorus]
MKKIVIFGCGGHAKVVVDSIRASASHTVSAFFDNSPKQNELLGLPVFSDLKELSAYTIANQIEFAVIAIGNNTARHALQQEAIRLGFKMATVIHPNTSISPTARIGSGTVVMPGVVVNSDAMIEDGCILNTGSIVEHDCTVGSFAHIAPGSVLCGGVSIGEMTLVGARSVAIPLIKVGSQVILGAGSVVVRDIPNNVCAIGNPAKLKI